MKCLANSLYASDIVKPSPLMGEGWVGVTSAQTWWLSPVDFSLMVSPETKMKIFLPSPRGRIPQVPGLGREGGTGRARHPPRPRQLRHPQGAAGQGMARAPPALSPALHADQRVLGAEPGRTLVCSSCRQA